MRGPITWLTARRMAAYQNELLELHYAEVENIYRQMRGWRHDYHNHIQAMQALSQGQNPALEAYLRQLNQDLTQIDTLIKTGNVMMDAILNSKLSLALSRGIQVDAAAYVPPELTVSDIDLCVIIGNLLDNAMEANQRLPEGVEPFLRLYVDVMKQQLYISVTNASGQVDRQGKAYQSHKGGWHGYGLMRVDKTVAKYKGYVNRQSEEGVFATEIMLPL